MKVKKLLYSFLAVIILCQVGYSQIAWIDRANGAGPTTTETASNMSATGLTRGAGLSQATGGDFNSNSWSTSSSSQANAEAANDYLQWSITASSGFEITLSQLQIRVDRSGTGPNGYQIYYSLDGFATAGTALAAAESHGGTSGSDYDYTSLSVASGAAGTITFRLYAWGSSSSGGTLDIEGVGGWAGTTVTDPGIRMFGSVAAAARSVTTYTFNGSWSPSNPSGTSTSSDNIAIVSSNASITSNTDCKNLTVAPGATLNLGVNTLTVSDTAYIQAGAAGYAQVIGAVSGTSQVQSYRTGSSAAWLNVAFPVDATLAAVSGVTISATGNASTCNIYRFDATTDGDANNEGDWVAISSTGDQTENIGYQLYVDNGANFGTFPVTITSTGTLLDGNQDVSVSDAQTNAWNLIPNPYASTVEWNLFTADADNSELANTTYYIQDGDPTVASIVYRSYNGTTGTNGGSNDIPPGQSFFVLADGTGNLTFKNSFRNVTGSTGLYKTTSTYSFVKLKVSNNSTDRSDEAVLGFDASFTTAMDNNFDGTKRRNSVYPNIFTKAVSGDEMIYNGISDQFTSHVEDVYFECTEAGNYTIEISEDVLPSNWTVTLKDKLTGLSINLKSAPYNFTHATGNVEDRFELHINQRAIGLEGTTSNNVYAYMQNGMLNVNLQDVEGYVELNLFDVSGKQLTSQTAEGNSTAVLNMNTLANGVYLIKVIKDQKEIYGQKIIK